MIKKILTIAAISVLTACGGGGDDDSSKELFSVWTRDGDAATFDLSGIGFGQHNIFVIDRDGSQCNCVLTVIGTQEQGTMALNQCTYVVGSSSRDPGCSSRNVAGNFTNRNSVLTLSSSNGSVTFR